MLAPASSGTPACAPVHGVPASLWGNRESVRTSEAVIDGGKALKIDGSGDDGTTTTYYFFLDRADCAASAGASVANSEAPDAGRTWYVATLNHDTCKAGMSPADRIRMIQDSGVSAHTRDFTSAAGDLYKVEVSSSDGEEETVYTYFRSRSDCLASLPTNQPIAAKYE